MLSKNRGVLLKVYFKKYGKSAKNREFDLQPKQKSPYFSPGASCVHQGAAYIKPLRTADRASSQQMLSMMLKMPQIRLLSLFRPAVNFAPKKLQDEPRLPFRAAANTTFARHNYMGRKTGTPNFWTKVQKGCAKRLC